MMTVLETCPRSIVFHDFSRYPPPSFHTGPPRNNNPLSETPTALDHLPQDREVRDRRWQISRLLSEQSAVKQEVKNFVSRSWRPKQQAQEILGWALATLSARGGRWSRCNGVRGRFTVPAELCELGW